MQSRIAVATTIAMGLGGLYAAYNDLSVDKMGSTANYLGGKCSASTAWASLVYCPASAGAQLATMGFKVVKGTATFAVNTTQRVAKAFD
jgi:hypothetical protein